MDRLCEKIYEIKKIIKNSVNPSETDEFEKAKSFFKNRIFEYKSKNSSIIKIALYENNARNYNRI